MPKYTPSLWWRVAIPLLLAALLATWCIVRLTTTEGEVRRSTIFVQTCSHYELLADGKPVMAFGADTTLSSACWADKWLLVPSCEGRLVVATDDSVHRNRYQETSPRDFLVATIGRLDSLHRLTLWKIKEFEYWSRSHNVQDEGYEIVNRYNQRQLFLRDSIGRKLELLRAINDKARLTIAYRAQYKVLFPDSAARFTYKDCELVIPADSTGITWMQLTDYRKPAHVSSQPACMARRYALMNALLWHRPINFNLRPDSTGVYRGGKDSLFRQNGHGAYFYNNGSFFEGRWVDGKRDGFGFYISYPQGIRTGEWKADKFLGERMLYSSERIYGIDISKYQHIKGRKRYAIHWDKLRITNLGNISKKRIKKGIDFPVSFVYIKSTEGASLLNPYYKKDYSAARKQGLRVGTYHFFSVTTPASKQARHFLKYSRILRGDLPPVLDVEPSEAQIRKMGGEQILFAHIRTWLRIVEQQCGRKPILYISQQFVNRHLVNAPDLERDYQVWIARYGEFKPEVRLAFWQLSPDGKVNGIQGNVDINVFNGYQKAYQIFLKENIIP